MARTFPWRLFRNEEIRSFEGSFVLNKWINRTESKNEKLISLELHCIIMMIFFVSRNIWFDVFNKFNFNIFLPHTLYIHLKAYTAYELLFLKKLTIITVKKNEKYIIQFFLQNNIFITQQGAVLFSPVVVRHANY